jgi:hypothetical protein
MPVKFLDASGSGSDTAAAEAIEYSIKHGARLSNNSWGGADNTTVLYNAIQDANAAGQIFVAAAGNSGQNTDTSPNYPSAFDLPNIVAVAAIDSSGNRASFSNYGARTVDIGAPGVGIYSTLPNGQYGFLSGTSMATPHVAGTLALMLAQNPAYTVTQAINQLLGTVMPDSAMAGITVSNGIVNAAEAVQTPNMDLNWTGGGLSGPATANTVLPFSMSRTYNVSGGAAPSNFVISYYASSSSDLHQNLALATLLGSETISAAGGKSVGSHAGTSPTFAPLPAGTYYLLAKLDSGDAFVETDETNNVAAAPQPLVVMGPQIVDNGAGGYSETGAWTTETVPSYGGNERYTTSNGAGQNTATWQVAGLATGFYQVQATWHPYPNQATNAPYTIYDGTTLLQTVTMNQTMPANGPAFGGVPFQTLATVKITSGTLKVVLSNTANGTYIVADAMREAPVPFSSTDLNWSATGDGVTGPASANVQTNFTINRTYTVSGAAAPGSFTITYYASTSADPNQDLSKATLLGSETLSASADLAVGNHSGVSPAFQFASGGSYYLLASLGSGSFVESDGANDANDVAITVQPVQVLGPVIVDNGAAGYSETGTWTTETVLSYNGTERYATSSGSGQNTATWQASGLATGLYQVQATWHPYNNEATNAPYAIYDGTTLLQTVPVNQTQTATGASFGGVSFQTLATVNITSGTLKVVLSNTGNGTYIVADAVRIAPAPVSSTDLNWSATGDGITGPTTVSAQTPFTISRTYTISGAAAPAKFTIAYYASTSASLSQNFSQATLLGTETLSASTDLALGNHSGTSPSLQLPNGGTYYLLAQLVADPSWAESDSANDTNDVAAAPQPVQVSGPVIVDNGTAGYSETGAWNTESVPSYGGTERYATSSGSGQNTATWQATGLPAGLYQVQATWHAYGNQATNAPYAIYDGSTLLQTVAVNQTVSPAGSSFGGVAFQTLATVNLTTGTLKVTVNNTGNGSYVVADAVRFAPVPVSNTDLNWSAAGDGITGPASVNQQTGFTINRTYTVSGAAAPSSFTIAYYASMSADLKQDLSKATFLGKETISAAADLAVGNHAGASPSFQFHNGGGYSLFAVLNADNSFTESDSAGDKNNLAESAQQTAVSGPALVDNGDPTYSETGAWFSQTDKGAYAGSDRYAAAGGTGSTTATWVVTGLAPGAYAIEASWGPYYNQSSNAPYAIYDNATLVQNVTGDQTKTPSGATAGGVPFQTLTQAMINSGTLKVVLSNSGNNTYLIADALRVEQIGASSAARIQAVMPSTAGGISVLSDQLPDNLSNNLVAFAATHYVGTQKMTSGQTARFRAVNSKWLELHYRLATESGPVQYITNNQWGSDWAFVTSHEDWFMHNAAGQRLSNSTDNWYLHDITNPAWRQYWVNSVIADMRAEGSQGVFADSFEAGVGSFWFDQYDVRFDGTNAGNPAYWPNGRTWMDLRLQLSNYMVANMAATPEGFLYLPNIDAQVTGWENMNYSYIDGAMLEDFGDWGGGYLKSGDPSNWTLSMNRALALSNQNKVLIMEPSLFNQPDAGTSPLQREFLIGTYLLIKGNYTYINMLAPHSSVNAYYFPEYQINLGPAITPLATDVSQYLWNGAYRRDFQNGIVLVNPTNTTLTINLGKTYQQVTGTGGGILSDASLDASGNYIGGTLHQQSVSQVTLVPGSAAILMN